MLCIVTALEFARDEFEAAAEIERNDIENNKHRATIEKLTFALFAKIIFLTRMLIIEIYYQRFVAGLSELKMLVAESNAPPKPYISTVATDSEVSNPELQACFIDTYEPGAVEVAEVE